VTDGVRQLEPCTNGLNGDTERDPKGRFLPGNKCSRGNPNVVAVAGWWAALAQTVTPDGVVRIVEILVEKAKPMMWPMAKRHRSILRR